LIHYKCNSFALVKINTEGKVTLLIPKQSLLAKKKLTPNYHGPVISPQNMMK
jgi:hypothetical protein